MCFVCPPPPHMYRCLIGRDLFLMSKLVIIYAIVFFLLSLTKHGTFICKHDVRINLFSFMTCMYRVKTSQDLLLNTIIMTVCFRIQMYGQGHHSHFIL